MGRFVLAILGVLFLLGGTSTVRAQTATVSGFVQDASDGQPLELVNVVLRAPDGTLKGAATDQDGLYLIPRLDPGRYALTVSFIGYETHTDTLNLARGQTLTVNIDLRPQATGLDEVLVQTERTSGAARVTAGQQTVRPADLELIPSPDLSADLATYLTTLPGVVTTGDRGGQLFIRGGEPSQNLFLVDGMTVYQPFHVLGFYSAFPADIMTRADIYAGGFGSRFGGRVSSVLDVATRNGNERVFGGAVSASPFISTLSVEGPIIPGRVSFLGSVRQSMIERTDEQIVGRPLPFDFGDAFLKVQGQVTQRSRLSASALTTYDRGTIAEDVGGAPPEEARWNNLAVGARYVLLPRILNVTTALTVSYSNFLAEMGPADDPARSSEIDNWRVALNGTFVGERVDVEAGWEMNATELESNLGGQFQNLAFNESAFTSIGFYAEPDFTLGNGFRVQPGFRLQFYRVRFDPYIEPRFRVVWERGIHQISGATGLYHQEMVGLNDRRDAASIFTAWTHIPRQGSSAEDVRTGRLARALHFILGYRVSPTSWLDFSIEGFHKQLTNLFIAEWTAFPRFTTNLQPANGHSSGFDLRLEARPSAFYAHINYGFSHTIYKARQASLQLWYGEESLRFHPAHDRRHQVNAVLSKSLLGFEASVRWEFGSGLPFSRVVGFDGFVFVDDIRDFSEVPSSRRVIYERPFNAVLPTYHRLDVSLDRTFSIGTADITLQGSIINVYDRQNIFYLDVFTQRQVNQLPFVPSVGLKVEL